MSQIRNRHLHLDLDMFTGLWLTHNHNFWGCWRFLTGVWYLVLDLDMFTGLWYTTDLNFGSLSCYWRCKEHPCYLSHHLGIWRMLEVPKSGLASWSWFGYGHYSLKHPQIILNSKQHVLASIWNIFRSIGQVWRILYQF